MNSLMLGALLIFFVAYLFIASEKINKTIVALLAAFIMIIFHIEEQHAAFSHVDYNVIFLLIGMMLLVKIIQQTGGFEYIAIKFSKLVNGNPYKIMIVLFLTTATLSAFLDNITTVLLISPISILIANEMEISPLPFLLTQIFGSNIGGTATLIGDPPNIMIGSAARLTFMDFMTNLLPVIILQLILFSIIFYLLFKGKMEVTNESRARIMDFDENKLIKNKPLLIKSSIVFGLVLIGLFIHGFLDLEASAIAFTGGVVLLLIGNLNPEEIFQKVEWVTIFFFIGLFIMVGGLVETGFIDLVSKYILDLTKGNIKGTAKLILWFSGIFSAIVDNIPYVATMIPLIKELGATLGNQTIIPLWWALSLGACLGGNGTLIGASANVIISDFARKSGYPITFLGFLKYSIPITALSLLISYFYIMVRYF